MTSSPNALRQTIRSFATFTWMTLALAVPQRGTAQSTAPPGSMTFALTGDAIITRRLSPFGEPEYLRMLEVIRSADLAFTNLEVLFHDFSEGYPATHSGGTWMAAEPYLAGELVWAGFDMVSRANNHTMDYSAGGLRATTRALDAVNLVHAGAGENLSRARAPAYLETGGGRGRSFRLHPPSQTKTGRDPSAVISAAGRA